MSNFDFLRDYDNQLYKLGLKIENNVNTSPAAVKTYATPFLEHVLELLLAEIGRKYNSRKEFYYQLDAVYRNGKISYSFKQKIYAAYQLRNRIHDNVEEMEKSEFPIAQQLHENLFHIAKKLYRDFAPQYDPFIGVPAFRPIDMKEDDGEVELIRIPEFSEVVEFSYDYCIICGEPNHSNYSLCCEKCNRIMDNANNFITIRNHLGSDAKFTKEDLIDYGIPEGYVNQLISSMVREKLLNVKGRYITFNNMYLEEFLLKIDKYIAVCELITRFKEDKITPKDLKERSEYKLGRRKEYPYYQFYKIAHREIVKKFERDILTTRDIWNTIDHTCISQEQLKRWYEIQMGDYRRGRFNEAFVVFNELLCEEYLKLKSEGILEDEIRATLNISPEVYEFLCQFKGDFEHDLKKIKLELIANGLRKGMTKSEIIAYAGVTAREYEDIFKVAEMKGERIAEIRKEELDSRKRQFVKYLLNFDLRVSCKKSKIELDDFYTYYESSSPNSEFYKKTTEILMDKFLVLRGRGKTTREALEKSYIKEEYLEHWQTRSVHRKFNDRYLKVKVDLILKGFKQRKPLTEISEITELSTDRIKSYVKLGEKGSHKFLPLFEYYEEKIIPEKLSKFLDGIGHKSIRKSQESANLTDGELSKYYELGKNGDLRFISFYEEFFKAKRGSYLLMISKGKSHKIALKESYFTDEEYEENREDLNESLEKIKQVIVIEEIKNHKTSTVAAKKANVTVDEIYEWYFLGKEGDEKYSKFYEAFHGGYVRPSINSLQKAMDNGKSHLDNLIRSNKNEFTKKDVETWVKNGLLDNKVLTLKKTRDEEEDDSKFDTNEMLREMGVKDYDRISVRKSSNSSSILNRNSTDAEKLKRQILKRE